MRRHRHLRAFAALHIDAQHETFHRLALHRNFQFERRTFVEMPDLCCIHPMPARDLARLQKKINGGRKRASIRTGGIAKRFAIVPALRMGRKFEFKNKAFCFG